MSSQLIEKLLDRMFAKWQKGQVRDFVESIRAKNDLTNRQIRVSGTLEDLRQTLVEALGANYLTVKELAQRVDTIEENGDQHVVLFDVADDSGDLSYAHARSRFDPEPKTPEAAFYADSPDDFVRAREEANGVVVIKQTHTTSYWRTVDTKTEGRSQTVYRELVDYRAVNLLRVEPAKGRAELRLARLSADESDKQVAERIEALFATMEPFVNVRTAFVPIPLWDAYHNIAVNRDETVMKWDSPSSGQNSIRISARVRHREAVEDIRDSADYPKSSPVYARDEVRVFWMRPPGGGPDRELFEVRLSDLKIKPMRFGKVELYDVLEPDAVTYILGRIRHLVGAASTGS